MFAIKIATFLYFSFYFPTRLHGHIYVVLVKIKSSIFCIKMPYSEAIETRQCVCQTLEFMRLLQSWLQLQNRDYYFIPLKGELYDNPIAEIIVSPVQLD